MSVKIDIKQTIVGLEVGRDMSDKMARNGCVLDAAMHMQGHQ